MAPIGSRQRGQYCGSNQESFASERYCGNSDRQFLWQIVERNRDGDQDADRRRRNEGIGHGEAFHNIMEDQAHRHQIDGIHKTNIGVAMFADDMNVWYCKVGEPKNGCATHRRQGNMRRRDLSA